MTDLTSEWVKKAEADFLTATREIRASEEDVPNYDAICFHAQQCFEKLIKANLVERNITPRKTHDLVSLSETLASLDASWNWPVTELSDLTKVGIGSRYPLIDVHRALALRLYDACKRARPVLLSMIGAKVE